jgi:hypothetical protein
MKFGIRTPSLKKRIAARISPKRYVRHSLGLKAPRGWGWLTNPKRAAYNRVYNRTTVSVDSLFRAGRRRGGSGDAGLVLALFWLAVLPVVAVVWLLGLLVKGVIHVVARPATEAPALPGRGPDEAPPDDAGPRPRSERPSP